MDELVDTALEILEIIEKNPGSHFRAITKEVDRQIGVVDYHLQRLEKSEQIIGIKDRGKKLFFPMSWFERISELKSLIGALRRKSSRDILVTLADQPDDDLPSLKQLSVKLQRSPSNLHWHVKRLIEDNLIIPRRKGRVVLLKTKVERILIHQLGSEIYPSRWDLFLDEIESRLGR